VFFGGTALSRTYLTASRLSEDLDLIAVAPRSQVAADLQAAIRTGLARSHGAVTWRPALTATTGSQPAVLIVDDQTSVQLQLVEGSGYTWPTEVDDLEQRYADAPPARMTVLTAPGAAAAKLSAWIERRAPRDLYDLWAWPSAG
jgi:predicted nucleotidyltransferase component of viral defense system